MVLCCQKGSVMHEIGHTIGFWHEQSRSDRDSYVEIVWRNIAEEDDNFKVIENTHNYDVPYDYYSLMHYGKNVRLFFFSRKLM